MFEFIIPALAFVVVVILLCMWLLPIYNVWAAHKEGQADLARAQNEQNIQIAEARARAEAAELNKKAAIIEAEAVSAQIEKIGAGLQRHDLFLRWQWIEMMRHRSSDADTIYVATEAGIPILEAGRAVS